MTELFNLAYLKERRRQLRKQPIPSEAILWQVIRDRRVRGYKFRRQYSIGPYIVDFYCPKLELIIEVDGESHHWPGRAEYDNRRQIWLEKRDLKIIRFSSDEVVNNLEGVVEVLECKIQELEGGVEAFTSPTPPCEGGV